MTTVQRTIRDRLDHYIRQLFYIFSAQRFISFFFNMATSNPNPSSLSISIDPLKYLGNLPEFSGDYRDLQNFINLIDRVHPILRAYDEPSQLLFSDIIKSKLKGKAREVIEINCQAQSWNDIKQILTNNFGERNSLEELFDRLKSVSFKTNSIEFYNEIKIRLRSLNNKTINLLGAGPAASECARNNMRTALNIFKEKVPEPMKTILTCRNPDSLETAIDILFQSGYAYNTGSNGIFSSNMKFNNPKHNQQKTGPERKSKNQYQNNNSQYNKYNNSNYNTGQKQYNGNLQNNSYQHRDNNYHYRNQTTQPNRPYYPQQNTQPYRQSYPQQIFTNPNYPQRNNQPPPEPMDINMVQNNAQTLNNTQYNNGANYRNPYNNYQPPDQNNSETYQNFPVQASVVNYPI